MAIIRRSSHAAESSVSEFDDVNKLEMMIVKGANISQLARIFHLDNRTVTTKLVTLKPSYVFGKAIFYHIREAAPLLCKPLGDMEASLRRMNPADLPPLLQKEFWNGQRARLDYEERTGQLWRVADVREKIAKLFAAVKMAILLTPDRIARDTDLSPKVQEKIRAMMDDALRDLQKGIQKEFETRDTPSDDSGESAIQGQVDSEVDDAGTDRETGETDLDAEGL